MLAVDIDTIIITINLVSLMPAAGGPQSPSWPGPFSSLRFPPSHQFTQNFPPPAFSGLQTFAHGVPLPGGPFHHLSLENSHSTWMNQLRCHLLCEASSDLPSFTPLGSSLDCQHLLWAPTVVVTSMSYLQSPSPRTVTSISPCRDFLHCLSIAASLVPGLHLAQCVLTGVT